MFLYLKVIFLIILFQKINHTILFLLPGLSLDKRTKQAIVQSSTVCSESLKKVTYFPAIFDIKSVLNDLETEKTK